MSRVSRDVLKNGKVMTGYDYDLQVWVNNHIIEECGHDPKWPHRCRACRDHGRDIRDVRKNLT